MASLKLVIVSAMTEWKVVKKHFPNSIVEQSPYGEYFVEGAYVYFHGGIGKISAAAATQYCIDKWSPDAVVNLGTCGGFQGKVNRGDIILAEKTVVYDILDQMGALDETIEFYSTEIDLSWLPTPYPLEVTKTVLVSGDRDLVVEEIPTLHKRWGAIAGDWESGSIAWVCKLNGVRSLILRGVSDLVGVDGGQAYDDLSVFKEGAELVMKKLLPSLPHWFK